MPEDILEQINPEDSVPTQNTRKTGFDERGKWLPGFCPNPSGRPKKLDKVEEYLNQLAGDKGEDFFNFLTEIMLYDQKKSKDRIPTYNANHKLKAVELLLAYQMGRPRQRIEAQIENKVLNINLNLPSNMNGEDI